VEKTIINLQTKRAEKQLVPISAKVATAVSLLLEVQTELEELYVSLDMSHSMRLTMKTLNNPKNDWPGWSAALPHIYATARPVFLPYTQTTIDAIPTIMQKITIVPAQVK